MLALALPSLGAAVATALTLILLGVLKVSIVCFTFAAVPLIYFALSAPLTALALSINFTCIILLTVSTSLCLFFLSVIAVPSLFFIAHIRRNNPVGLVLSDIALYAALLIAAIEWILLGEGGISGVISQAFAMNELSAIDPDLVKQISWLSSEGSFLLVSAAVWWGILLFYAAAWVACALKTRRIKANFRHYALLTPFQPPAVLFLALILCAIISLLPSKNLAFAGMSGFVIILLPYCFSGAMYTPLRGWRGMQTGWVFLVMILLMVFAWPAAILCTIGVWKHAEILLRKKH